MITLTKKNILAQETMIRNIRSFFDAQDFHEIHTPVLNHAIPLEEHIHPFTTQWETINGTKAMYLPASPERALKLALSQGIDRCYSIGHSFRNLEQSGPLHSPEFLMLEWYRKDATYLDIMKDVEQFMRKVCRVKEEWITLSFLTLFPTHVGVSLESLLIGNALQTHMQGKGYAVENASWHELFDQLFLNEIEPHFPASPFFLTDFPARISPLCKPTKENPLIAERFEVYINGIEIGNGNSEETNSQKIRKVFNLLHEHKNQPIDEKFLSALNQMQGGRYAGIGIGIERLPLASIDA